MKKKVNKEEVVVKRPKINPYLDRFIHIIGYTLVLITVSVVFDDTVYIDNQFFGLWGLLAMLIIYILNK